MGHTGKHLLGRFRVGERVGAGGMGDVYAGVDEQTGDKVAIKFLARSDDKSAKRFTRECEVMSKLDHPHVVRYVGHGVVGTSAFVAMEWLDGPTLKDRLRDGALSAGETLDLARRTADALAHAHAASIVHRDVKPANIMLVGGELQRVKLLDFGIATIDGAISLTKSNEIIGTVRYMCPEQARATHTVDARADVFSLGCVLFECLTGTKAYPGDNLPGVLAQILFEDPPRASQHAAVPDDLDALVERMMARDASERPAHGGEVHELLSVCDAQREEEPDTVLVPRGLSDEERRVLAAVALRVSDDTPRPAAAAAFDFAQGMVEDHGGKFEQLADGTALALFSDAQAPRLLAVRATACALELVAHQPCLCCAVALGRGVVGAQTDVGDVVDAAAAALEQVQPGSVATTVASSDLLSAHFTLDDTQEGTSLVVGPAPTSVRQSRRGNQTRMVGRATELLVLEALFQECVAHRATRGAAIVGTPGMGKARLVEELLESRSIRRADPIVWSARADPVGSARAYRVANALVRDAALALDDSPDNASPDVDRLLRQLLDGDATTEVFVREMLGEPQPAEAQLLVAARRSAALMARKIAWAWCRLLEAASRDRPLLIVVEDLQWADTPTCKLLGAAFEQLAPRPVVVLVTARPEAKSNPSWPLAERCVELPLSPLPDQLMRQLASDLTGGDLDEQSARLVDRAEGNPGFLEELLRARRRTSNADAVPLTLFGTLQLRIDHLDKTEKRALRAASILGRQFSAPGVDALTNIRGGASETLDKLVAGDLLTREGPTSAQRYAFRSPLMREVAYDSLTEGDRELGHAMAADALERQGADAATVARHHRLGGKPERAAPLYLDAATASLAVTDNHHARELAAHGLACQPDSLVRARLHLAIATADARTGDAQRSHEYAKRALSELEVGAAAWYRAVGLTSRGGMQCGAPGEPLRPLVDAVAAPVNDDAAAQSALDELARSLHVAYEHGAGRLTQRIVARMSQLAVQLENDPVSSGHYHAAMATHAACRGDLPAALEGFERSVADMIATGDDYSAAVHMGNLASTQVKLGRYDDACRNADAALAVAARAGARYLTAAVLSIRSLALLGAGQAELAVEVARGALDKAAPLNNPLLWSQAQVACGKAELALGNVAAAALSSKAAVSSADGFPAVRAWALALGARVMLARGLAREAQEHAEEGMRLLEHLGALEEGEAELRLAHARALLACGDPRAADVIRRAQRWLRAKADRIDDDALRGSFMRNVHEHAELMTLSRAPVGGF